MFGNIILMLSRPKSAPIIDSVYVSYANSQQKAFMRQELYGDLYKTVNNKYLYINGLITKKVIFQFI